MNIGFISQLSNEDHSNIWIKWKHGYDDVAEEYNITLEEVKAIAKNYWIWGGTYYQDTKYFKTKSNEESIADLAKEHKTSIEEIKSIINFYEENEKNHPEP